MNDVYTSNGKRFLAILIDLIIVSVIANFVTILLYLILGVDKTNYDITRTTLLTDFYSYMTDNTEKSYLALMDTFNDFLQYFFLDKIISLTAFLIVGIIYFTIIPLISDNYQTLGRLAGGIKVINKENFKYNKSRMFVREICFFIIPYLIFGFLFLGVSGIVALASKKSLTDLMSRTRLVPKFIEELAKEDEHDIIDADVVETTNINENETNDDEYNLIYCIKIF